MSGVAGSSEGNCLRYEVADGIATVTLNRPEKLNVFSSKMMAELLDVFDRIDADDKVRAVVVTGSGRAFCAGADLSQGTSGFTSGDGPTGHVSVPDATIDYSAEDARDSGGRVTLRIFRCLKPLIAAINGPAVGFGITMTLPMDIRLASTAAKIGFVFARRGIVPEAASSWFLPRVVGISQAMEWCATGRLFSADEALKGDLVRSIHEPANLMPAAYQLAREIAHSTSAVSVALTRQMMWRSLGWTHPMEAHRIDSRGIASRARSADAAEGVAAFFAKRQPAFPDCVSTDMPDYFPWWEEPEYR